jgi:hypothetical protein
MAVTSIALGANIATAIGATTNTTFQLASGIYRQKVPNPGSGNALIGYVDGSTVISGAWLLNGTWTNTSGTLWKTTTGSHDTSAGQVAVGAMTFDTTANNNSGQNGGYPLCVWCNEVFVDNVIAPFIGQGTTAAPLSPAAGQWWFNTTDNSINFNASGLGTFPGTHVMEYSNWNNANSGTISFSNNFFAFTLMNITFEKYATVSQQGVYNGIGAGCSMFGCTFQWNHGCALNFSSGAQITAGAAPMYDIRKCRILNNGQEGLNTNSAHGLRIIDCEFAFNNRAGYNFDWDAGGMKFVFSHGGVFQGNYVHDNYGHGAWWDVACSNWHIADNYVVNNIPRPLSPDQGAMGIMYEISYGGYTGTSIFRNVVVGHKGAGIYVSSSDACEVYQNVIIVGTSNSGTGRNGAIAVAVNDARTNGFGGAVTVASVPNYVANINVHDNTIIHLTDTAADGFFINVTLPVARNWTWDYNTYIVPNATQAYWMLPTTANAGGTPITWATLQSQGVFEQHGQQIVVTPNLSFSAEMTALRDGQAAGSITPAIVRAALLSFESATNTRFNLPPNNWSGGNLIVK